MDDADQAAPEPADHPAPDADGRSGRRPSRPTSRRSRPSASGPSRTPRRPCRSSRPGRFEKIQSDLIPIIEQVRKDKGSTSSSTWSRAGPSISIRPST
ncbi:MAG: hypothetical protein M0C28_00765 [Candidatus Moduliflexus flocculans]|nr:hypothetical protein [Candidatus Moduliflexus flocculans]